MTDRTPTPSPADGRSPSPSAESREALAEAIRLARVAVAECPSDEPMVTDWVDCAMQACRRLAALAVPPQPSGPPFVTISIPDQPKRYFYEGPAPVAVPPQERAPAGCDQAFEAAVRNLTPAEQQNIDDGMRYGKSLSYAMFCAGWAAGSSVERAPEDDA